MEYVVTGGTGFVGGRVVRQFLADGHDVVADVAEMDPPRAVTPALFRWLAAGAGLLERVVTLPEDYRAERLRVLAGATYLGDNSKASAELGLEHRPLREGLAETVRHELERLEEETTAVVERA